jgi:hypothetical protein
LTKLATDAQGKYLYASIKDSNAESIWRIDLASGNKQKVYTFDPTVTAINLFMNDQMICFINARDGKLYTIVQ